MPSSLRTHSTLLGGAAAALLPLTLGYVIATVERRFPPGESLAPLPHWIGYAALWILPPLVIGVRGVFRALGWHWRLRSTIADRCAELAPVHRELDAELDGEIAALEGRLLGSLPLSSKPVQEEAVEEKGLEPDDGPFDDLALVVGEADLPLEGDVRLLAPARITLREPGELGEGDAIVADRELSHDDVVLARGLVRCVDVAGGEGYRGSGDRWKLLPDPDRGAIILAARTTRIRLSLGLLLRGWTWPLSALILAICVLTRVAASYHQAALLCTNQACAEDGNCTVTTARFRTDSIDRMVDPFRCWPTEPHHCEASQSCREGGYCHLVGYGCLNTPDP